MYTQQLQEQHLSSAEACSPNPSAAFVMEQHLGHATFFQNLHGDLSTAPDIDINWVRVRYDRPSNQLWEKIPKLPQRVRSILRARAEVQQGLRDWQWDVAFFNTHVPGRMAGGLLRNRPYVISTDITPLLHDTMSEHYGRPVTKNGLLQLYKHKVHTTLFQNAAKVLPWSNWVRSSLINDYGVDPEKIEVISPGVNLEIWQPASDIHTERHLADQKMRILFVGGDFYRKGGDLLLRAFQRLPEGIATLDIVTRTELSLTDLSATELEAGPGISVYNDLVPNDPRLLTLYRASDLFVFPTQAEAFGIAATEAAVMGLPVVASYVGGLADIVAHEETGFLFHPDDEEQLLAYLMQMAVTPAMRKEMGAAAKKRALHLFDARRNAARILAVVQEAAQLNGVV